MRKLVNSAVLSSAVLLGLALPSYANTIVPAGTLGSYDTGIVNVTSAFTTDYQFNVTSFFDVFVDLNFAGSTKGVVKSIDLFSGTAPTGTSEGDLLTATAAKGELSFTDGHFAPGSYYAEVIGGKGSTGSYDLAIDVSPVPLPAALPLFLGGIGLMGFLMWRRKRQDVSGYQGSALTIA